MSVEELRLPAPAAIERVESVAGLAGFLALERDWRRLTWGDGNPFLHWEWVAAWASAFWSDDLLTVVVHRGPDVVAIAPFVRARHRVLPGVKAVALQLLGPGDVQFAYELRCVAALGRETRSALRTIVKHLEGSEEWDWLELGTSLEDEDADPELQTWPGSACRIAGPVEQPVPVITLRRSWEEQRGELRRNVKESVRHCYNSLKRAGVDFSFRVIEDPADVVASIDNVLRLHRERSQVSGRVTHADAFSDRRLRAFLQSSAPRLAECGMLRVGEIVIDGSVVAARICFDVAGWRYFYYSGFEPAWWHFSVMTLLTTELIKDAIERGLDRVNLSPGTDQAKSRWNVRLGRQRSWVVVRQGDAAVRRRLLLTRRALTEPLRRQRTVAAVYFRARRILRALPARRLPGSSR